MNDSDRKIRIAAFAALEKLVLEGGLSRSFLKRLPAPRQPGTGCHGTKPARRSGLRPGTLRDATHNIAENDRVRAGFRSVLLRGLLHPTFQHPENRCFLTDSCSTEKFSH
ncbi:MAG: hypothetical protein OXD44_10935 [Gammaproteobacteria bacterium]|nr:hypothetical protein [Gammaproteobacteria bacterium]